MKELGRKMLQSFAEWEISESSERTGFWNEKTNGSLNGIQQERYSDFEKQTKAKLKTFLKREAKRQKKRVIKDGKKLFVSLF